MAIKDSESVKLWRDTFHLNLSLSWKKDVETTVMDIKLWREILANWHYFDANGKKHKKSPAIKPLLDEYERLEADKRDNETAALPTRSEKRLSERSHSELSKVSSEPPSCYFRVD